VAFGEGRERVIITKASIAGFGLNWQHCARMAFVGLSFSYEAYYQAIRRCWRFGQKRPVHVHVAMADTEKAIFDTIARKSEDHDTMKRAMTLAMSRAMRSERQRPYDATLPMSLPSWLM
jgi:SNF2 family DNA or RNA helicase